MIADVERIRGALHFIPARDRDTWVKVAMAIKSEIGDAGFDVWEEWSQQDESFDHQSAKAVWKSINGGGKVTAGTLFHEAKAHGWRDDGTHHKPTAAELAERRRVSAERAAKDEAERTDKHAEAARRARQIWDDAAPADDSHAYLARKGIKAHGLRIYRGPLAINQMRCNGALIVPMEDAAGELCSLQFIAPEGEKRFQPGGRVAGCYFSIGTTEGAAALCVAEGFATGATINEATGYPVAVAFNAGNLEAVARALRAKLPDLRLVLCADDDAATEGNPGLTKATEAARAVGALVAIPDFGTERPEGATDFNDMRLHCGAEAVAGAIAGASAPAVEVCQPDPGNAPACDPDPAARGERPAAEMPAQSAGSVSGAHAEAVARPSKSRAAPLDWHELAARGEPPARRWAIKGWLGFGHVTLLVGPGGIGKTLIAQQAGSCLALGRAFIDEIPGPLPTLAWCAEDDHNELWRRQVNIARWLGVPLDEFSDSLILEPRAGLDNALMTSEFGRLMFTPLIEELREQAGDCRAQVVILDNVAQMYGANENDRHAVTMFLNALVGALPGRAILLLAHPARGTGSEFSGSSAWENCARTRLYLGDKLPDQKGDDTEPADDVRYLSRRKANYSSKDYRRLMFSDGVLVPDEVEAAAPGGIIDHLRREKAVRVVVAAVDRLRGMDVRTTDGSTSPNFLPKQVLEYKLGEGFTKRELADAMRRAMLDGKLSRGVVGQYSNRAPMQGLIIPE